MRNKINEKYFPLLETEGKKKIYKEDAMIFTQQDSADTIYFILSGRVRVYVDLENGRSFTFDVLDKGSIFGDSSFLPNGTHKVSIKAVVDTTIVSMDVNDSVTFLAKYPDLLKIVLGFLSENCNDLTQQIIRMKFYDAPQKVADFLLSKSEGKKTIPYTQEDVAVSTGMNRVTVTRILNSFKKQELVSNSYGLITILDRKGLRKIRTGKSD